LLRIKKQNILFLRQIEKGNNWKILKATKFDKLSEKEYLPGYSGRSQFPLMLILSLIKRRESAKGEISGENS
jgi:hypothetical protein